MECLMNCNIQSIRAIYYYPEAYYVDLAGIKTELLLTGAPQSYLPEFKEFCCIEHDCNFKQWRAVLAHLGRDNI